MKVIFFGASHYVLPIISSLKENYNLDLVFTTEINPTDSVIKFCNENNIKFISTKTKANLETEILKLSDLDLGIVADFGVIISKPVLNHFRHGILNIHPSLLPKFRGPTPVQSTLLAQQTKTGVSIIKLDEEIDHGPIIAQEEYLIKSSDTTITLLTELFKLGAELLIKSLPAYLDKSMTPHDQQHEQATFTKTFTKNDGFININEFSDFTKLNVLINALYPWPGVWTKTNVNNDSEKIIKFLPNKKIQVEGKKEMFYKDFLNGYPSANPQLRSLLEENE